MDGNYTRKGIGKMDKRQGIIDVFTGIGFFMAMLAGATMDDPNAVNITIALCGALIILICSKMEERYYG